MNPFSSWLTSPAPDAVLEIAVDRVSAAVVSARGSSLAVTAHTSEPLPAGAVVPSLTASNIPDRAHVVSALRKAVDRVAPRGRRVALVIPDSAAKVSLVRFDHVPVRREDLDQVVRWQVRKSTPFPIEEAVVSYTPGIAVGEQGREFLVEVARRSVVGEYEAVCGDAGLQAGLVDIATLSLLELVLGAGELCTGDWLLVHVRMDSSSIAIVRGDSVIFYRNRAEGEQEGLSDLVHQTAMYYEDRLEGAGFARVLVAGLGRNPSGADLARRSFEERLGLSVETVDPTLVATVADRIHPSADILDVLGPLVGMSLRGLHAGAAA